MSCTRDGDIDRARSRRLFTPARQQIRISCRLPYPLQHLCEPVAGLRCLACAACNRCKDGDDRFCLPVPSVRFLTSVCLLYARIYSPGAGNLGRFLSTKSPRRRATEDALGLFSLRRLSLLSPGPAPARMAALSNAVLAVDRADSTAFSNWKQRIESYAAANTVRVRR
jgi:hypothetical protein